MLSSASSILFGIQRLAVTIVVQALEPGGTHCVITAYTGTRMYRELAVQLDQQVEALGRSCNVRHLLVVGGLDQFGQATELRKRPHIVVATPGRLADILNTSAELQQGFKRTAVLVLDEADRVLEPCFEQPLRDIMKVLCQTCVPCLVSTG